MLSFGRTAHDIDCRYCRSLYHSVGWHDDYCTRTTRLKLLNLFHLPLDTPHTLWYNYTMKQYSREIKVKGGILRIVKISRTSWQWTVFLANNVFHATTMEQSSPRCYEIQNPHFGTVLEETQFRVVQRFMELRYGIEI